MIFNHGSGSPKVLHHVTVYHPEVAQVLAQHGIATLVPMRRGRGKSGGKVNDNATCDYPRSFAAVKHAEEDINATVAFVKNYPQLDAHQLFFGGQSRGSLLSTYYVGEHPELKVKGVIDFAGGWMATRVCTDFGLRIFKEAGAKTKAPSMFIYGEKDTIMYEETAKDYTDAFTSSGGVGTLKIYPTPSWAGDGHFIANFNAKAWAEDVGQFLEKLGYPKASANANEK